MTVVDKGGDPKAFIEAQKFQSLFLWMTVVDIGFALAMATATGFNPCSCG